VEEDVSKIIRLREQRTAVRVPDTRLSPEWFDVMLFLVGRPWALEERKVDNRREWYVHLATGQNAFPGDWLVSVSGGQVEVVMPEEFDRRYQVIGQTAPVP
jgi:hypothetical protein